MILSCEPGEVQSFWLNDYAPDVLAVEARRYPSGRTLCKALGLVRFEMRPVPIPLDCADGFNEAYYGRPEMLLLPQARRSCSAWSFVTSDSAEESVAQLEADLDAGIWDQRHGQLRTQPSYDGSLYLYIARQ